MRRLIPVMLLAGVLGCGSGDESQPQVSADEANAATHVAEPKVDELIAEGKRFFDKKKYDAAIETFSKAIQLDGQNAVAHRERAQARMFSAGHSEFVSSTLNLKNTEIIDVGPAVGRHERQVFQAAHADLKAAIRLDTSDVEAHKLQGRCLFELGDDKGAIAALDEAIRIAPQDADAYHKRGTAYSQSNSSAKAMADFTRAIELDPKMAKSLLGRGSLKCFTGDAAGSLADFDAAIRLDNTDSMAYANRALAYIRLHDCEKAVASCTKAAELAPRKWSPYYNRGIAYLGLEQPSKAIADFNKAISLDSENCEPHVNLAAAYMMTGLFSKAMTEIDTAIELAPNVAELHRIRAEMLTEMDRPNEARTSRRKSEWLQHLAPLNQAIIRQPKDSQSYQRRAEHYADDDQWENAISDFSKALQLEPESVDALIGRAKAWLAQGKFQKAIDDCEHALKLSTQREIYSVRGDAYLGLSDHNRAIADYERAKRFDAQVALAYLLRSKERKAAGEISAAAEDLRQAIAIDPSVSERR
ncbi:MAG: tetratricopeptide repeat protein [Planctomycetaceae bacterium]|jgi:tetratricopeptide (TPR) repeat protein|nr:tetratricopeptide repeat protein [Planctomycetaceae bacterium]MBT6157766.1 tetratricopeptide repeat protein [Planctomycetaceae bacterium]MBT6484552.1 tetratricopeptide repeat protein [Planctomycetaceae bacterium]MBT6497984.1 tetratricopeptide repeat protein [Planctomycetaceae bacterium]